MCELLLPLNDKQFRKCCELGSDYDEKSTANLSGIEYFTPNDTRLLPEHGLDCAF